MNEIFVDIVGYEGRYQISNFGNVKALDRIGKNQWGGYFKKGKLMTVNKVNRYSTVNLMINWVAKPFKIHRLVAQAFIPNPQNKPQINHKNGNRYDNRVENLEWCTQSENMQHAKKMGLRPNFKGEKNPSAKLTYVMVKEIQQRYSEEKTSMRKLASEYNVCPSKICNAINNNFWNSEQKIA